MRYNDLRVGLLVLLVAATSVAAESMVIKVYGPEEKVAGKSHADWGAEWWKWALSAKKDVNPVTDKTGAFAATNQPKGLWFLAGNFGGKSQRRCTIPAGIPIFVPVFNYYASQVAKERTADELTKYTKAMADEAKDVVDRGMEMTLDLDGATLKDFAKHRFVSALFETNAPELKDAVHLSVAGKQTGVCDGYWVILPPLAEGKHTLRIRSKLKAKPRENAFEMDVSYELTVAAKK